MDDEQLEKSSDFAGVPDAFQRLWTPHRMVYIESNKHPTDTEDPFCVAPTLTDEKALIVARGKTAYVILNLFPYNSGHLLVCPYRHVAMYDEATADEITEIGTLTQTAMQVLSEVAHCEGFNIGMNQGRIAGAGVADHLHQHIVPRWGGDTNFMPVLADVKVIPEHLSATWAHLTAAWPRSS